MMAFIRGSAITFRATCKDAAGVAFTPKGAALSLSYVGVNGTRFNQSLPMTIDGDSVSCIWDSSVASDAMPVHWHIRASSGADKVAQDGSFTLSAMDANPTK